MFRTASEKDDLNQISLTGMRAVVLLGLLMIAPRSMEEIRKAFVSYKIMEESDSIDILRVDLNSLKYMGCEISRSSQKTNFKYVLGEHPFSLKITKDDIKAVKKVYGEIKKKANIGLLIEYHELFTKIAGFISNPELKEEFLGISELKHFKELNTIKELLVDCEQERALELIYSNQATGKNDKKTIIANKLVFNNDKIYLYGYDTSIGAKIVLNFKRIKQILSRKLYSDNVDIEGIKIKFKIDEISIDALSDEETVIEASDNGYIVEGTYYNEFFAIQRMLSFGAGCTVLEPTEFKGKIISKIKEMRKVYDK